MIRKPTAPSRASRHPYSTRGLSLRFLLLGAMLTSLAIAVAGGQPGGASSAGRERASDSVRLADGGPIGGPGPSGPGGPAGGESAGGTGSGPAGDGAPAGSDGGIVPAASASPLFPGGGSAGGPSDDWHLYNHWTDPSWPDPGQATGEQLDPGVEPPRAGAPLPARTAGGYSWEPPVTPTTEPSPPTGWTPSPDDPTDPAPGTPTGPPTTTGPVQDPTNPDEEPDSPTPPRTSSTAPPGTGVPPGTSGEDQPDGSQDGVPSPGTTDPLHRDPVAAGPDDGDLGLGETVDEPTPTPEPSASGRAPAPLRAAPADPAPAGEYQHTLIYSGMIGLALAAIGLTMVGLRRRRW
jgi:hypothetical protein